MSDEFVAPPRSVSSWDAMRRLQRSLDAMAGDSRPFLASDAMRRLTDALDRERSFIGARGALEESLERQWRQMEEANCAVDELTREYRRLDELRRAAEIAFDVTSVELRMLAAFASPTVTPIPPTAEFIMPLAHDRNRISEEEMDIIADKVAERLSRSAGPLSDDRERIGFEPPSGE